MRYITGSSGFIGSHYSRKTECTSVLHENIERTTFRPFTHFYFFSGYGNMAHHTNDDAMYKANIMDLIRVLQQARSIDFKSFAYISTSSVKLKRQTTYSRLKRAAEEILLAFMEKHNKPVCIIRPFSVTGIGEQPEHLIPTLIRAAYTGELVNFVPGPTHDFIDIDDLTDGIMTLTENGARGVYELGTGISHSNQEVLQMVEWITGKKININIIPTLREYDTQNWVSTNMKARGYGWTPKKKLEQSIEEMVKDYTFNYE